MATMEVEVQEDTEVKEVSEENTSEKTEEVKEEAPAKEADVDVKIQTDVKEMQDSVNEAKELVTEKGLDFDALTKEYEEKGALSQETYKALEEKGLTKKMVDTFIRGVEAGNKAFVDTVHSYAGGVREYNKLTKYVEAQGKEAVEGFNAMIESGNLQGIKMLINGIKAEMTLKNGTSNSAILGSNAKGDTAGFANEAAWVKAVDDPRYGSDEAYTKQVAEKLMKSSFVQFN